MKPWTYFYAGLLTTALALAPNTVKKENFVSSLDWQIHYAYSRLRMVSEVKDNDPFIVVSGKMHRLFLVSVHGDEYRVLKWYEVSTGAKGFGKHFPGSCTTPYGAMQIFVKCGVDARLGEIIERLTPTGQTTTIYDTSPGFRTRYITTRALTLKGLEPDNSEVEDSGIYIHGVADEYTVGTNSSLGCIGMRNRDIRQLFNMVHRGTLVYVIPDK